MLKRVLGHFALLSLGFMALTGQMQSGAGSAGSSGAAGRQINQWYDVTDSTFGAVGDSSTNDFSAIQAAIDAAEAAGGGTVYFPPGVYVVSDSVITVTGGGVRLYGSGSAQNAFLSGPNKGTTLLFRTSSTGDSTQPCIIIGDATSEARTDGYRLQGIQFKAQRDTSVTPAAHVERGRTDILHLVNVEYSQISECGFSGKFMSGPDTTSYQVRIWAVGDSTNRGSNKITFSQTNFLMGTWGDIKSGGVLIDSPPADSSGTDVGAFNNSHHFNHCYWQNNNTPARAVLIRSTGSAANGHTFTGCRFDGRFGMELRGSYNNVIGDSFFDHLAADTALWVNPIVATDAVTAHPREGTSVAWGGHINGQSVSDNIHENKGLQSWGQAWRSGPHISGISLQDMNNLPGISAVEDTSGYTPIYSLGGRLVKVTDTVVDSISVIGDPSVPRGYVDITDPPFYASPLDSVTNSVAIQAAIDAAYALGAGGIYIPPGEFVVAGDSTSSLDINLRSGVDVVGAGKSSTTIRMAGNCAKQTVLRGHTGDSNITIKNLTIDGNFANTNPEIRNNGAMWGIRFAGPATGVVVENVIITDVTHGVWVGGNDMCGTVIDGCDIQIQSTASTMNNGNKFIPVSGIRLPNGTCGSWIRNTYVTGGYPDITATDGQHGYGFEIGGQDTRIDGCWVSDFSHGSPVVATSAGGIGVNIPSTAKRTTITDLSLTTIGWHGIAVAGSTVAINGLQARNVDGYGIWLDTGAYQVTLDTNNSFTNVDSLSVGGDGFPDGLSAGLFFGNGTGTIGEPDSLYLKRLDTDAALTVVK